MISRSRKNWPGGEPGRALLESCLREHLARPAPIGAPARLLRGAARHRGSRAQRGPAEFARAPRLPALYLHDGRGLSDRKSRGLHERGAAEALEAVLRAYAHSDIDNVDAELARDASVCGRGVELMFADAQARPRSAALSPLDAFVVYDDSVEARPLLGVRLAALRGDDGKPAAGRSRRTRTRRSSSIARNRSRR